MHEKLIRIPDCLPAVKQRLYEMSAPTSYVRSLLLGLKNFDPRQEGSRLLPDTKPLRNRRIYKGLLYSDELSSARGAETFRLNFKTEDEPLLAYLKEYFQDPLSHRPVFPTDKCGDEKVRCKMTGQQNTYRDLLYADNLSSLVTALVLADVYARYDGHEEATAVTLAVLDLKVVDKSNPIKAHATSRGRSTSEPFSDLCIKLSDNWSMTPIVKEHLSAQPSRAAYIKWLLLCDVAQAKDKPLPPRPADCGENDSVGNTIHLSLRGPMNAELREWLADKCWQTSSVAMPYLKATYDNRKQNSLSYYIACLVQARIGAEKKQNFLNARGVTTEETASEGTDSVSFGICNVADLLED